MSPRKNLIVAIATVLVAFAAINLHYLFIRSGADIRSADDARSRDDTALRLAPTPVSELLAGAIQVQRAHEPQLLALPAVTAVGVSLSPAGLPQIKVFVDPALPLPGLPGQLGAFPVLVRQAGPFMAGPPAAAAPATEGGPAPTGRFDRPVPIGVSTGHTRSTAGTIGAVVTDGTRRYALSNWHVFVPAGDAKPGDSLLQPGPVDGGSSPDDVIGTLAAFEPVILSPTASNRIDAAIALTDQVVPRTPPGGYGSPRTVALEAKPGMGVQKYGRTTRLTTGTVEAVNASVNVVYGSAGSSMARFTGQIMVCCNFSQGGDSGSLIVARDRDRGGDPGPNDRKPVALLFAGDGRLTIGNPIALVLDAFGVAIAGEEETGS